jgi:hypothetical protein
LDDDNVYHTDARLTANAYHPIKSNVNSTSVSANRLICTYGNISTNTDDRFLDENYRLPNGTYDSVPASLTGNWDSTVQVGAEDAVIYNQQVGPVATDFSGYLPAGPDYSSKIYPQYYLRGFYSANANSGMTLALAGLTSGSISPVGTGDLNVEIKLPGLTGWLDVAVPFSAASFTGADGDGCQVSVSGDDFNVTFGTFSTSGCSGTVIMRATYRTSNGDHITRITANNY